MTTETHTRSTQLSFDDNSTALLVTGENNQYLNLIESALDVTCFARGTQLAIEGEPLAVQSATDVIHHLIKVVHKQGDVTHTEVEALLRVMADSIKSETTTQKTSTTSMETHHMATETMTKTMRDIAIHTPKRTIKPYTPIQAEYIHHLLNSEIVFGAGPAGTGKTYLAVAAAVALLESGEVERIILSRPAVEAGEKLGFLPGDMKEKVDPYLRPLYDALYDTLPGDKVTKYMENGTIEIAPLAYMRGRTLKNAYVILDEAQNTSPVQMKMFLTRLGENSHMTITGDLSQTDLPKGMRSGFRDAMEKLDAIEEISIIRFTTQDVVRHPLTVKIAAAYEAHESDAKWHRPGA